MPDWIKFPFVLVVVALISAVSLAYLNDLTEPARQAEALTVKKAALSVVLPDAKDFKEESELIDGKEFEYYEGTDADGKLTGYAATGAAVGYSSTIKVMVGFDKDYKIIAVEVLSQKETPGLGDKVNEILSRNTLVNLVRGIKYDETGLRPWFQVQFNGKIAPVRVRKDGGDIEAITGATISSRAVCDAVDLAAKNLKSALDK